LAKFRKKNERSEDFFSELRQVPASLFVQQTGLCSGSGTGLLFCFTEKERQVARTVVHAIALDEPHLLDQWQLEHNADSYTLQSDTCKWTLQLQDEMATSFSMISGHGRRWDIESKDGQHHLKFNTSKAQFGCAKTFYKPRRTRRARRISARRWITTLCVVSWR